MTHGTKTLRVISGDCCNVVADRAAAPKWRSVMIACVPRTCSERIGRFLVVVLLVLTLSACVASRVPSPQEHMRAMEILDRGVLALREGEVEKAHQLFELSHQIAPSAAALDGLGCVAVRRGDAQEAQRLFLQALEHDPQYVEALSNLAFLYEAVGWKAESAQLYRQVLERDPTNMRARNNFASLLHEQGEEGRREAFRQLQHAASLGSHPVIERNLRALSKKPQ